MEGISPQEVDASMQQLESLDFGERKVGNTFNADFSHSKRFTHVRVMP